MDLNLTNVAIFGEHLRDRLLATKPPLIKSRRQLFRSYPNTFVGSEVVDWLLRESQMQDAAKIESDESCNNNKDYEEEVVTAAKPIDPSAETVAQVMQALVDFGVLHCLHGDFPFKNDSSLYRFTTDDGSCCGVVEALVKGKRLYKTTLCPDCALLQRVCEYGEFISDKCMRGSDLIAWIIEHGLASHREDAKRVCRLMFDHGIIKPATKHVDEFVDGRPFYIFGVDYTLPVLSVKTFIFLLTSSTPKEIPSSSTSTETKQHQHVRQFSGQLMDTSVQDNRSIGRQKNASSSSVGSDDSGYNDIANAPLGVSPPTYESLLRSDGKHTPEALAHPSAPFVRKEMRIYPDAVGYGFIIRGSSPCYVKIVDPESPAGKSGLKAWQYIIEINNRDVMRKVHTELEDLILNGPKCLLMTVMRPKDEEVYAQVQRLYTETKKTSQPEIHIPKPFGDLSGARRQSAPAMQKLNTLPSAQPWMKQQRKASDFGDMFPNPNLRFIH